MLGQAHFLKGCEQQHRDRQMQNAQRILPRLLCLLLAHGLHTAMASGNGTAGVAAQGTASAEQVAKHSPAGLATSASASVANSSVHSVTFPPAPQPAAQARDCLLKAFNSSTARDKKVGHEQHRV